MNMDQLHQIIARLAELRKSNESKEQYLDQLRKNVTSAVELLPSCEELKNKVNETDKVTVAFISTSLYVMKELSKICEDDTLTNLISIQQQQKIKLLLQMIFSIGLFPALFQGVNILLGNKTVELNLFDLEDLTRVELYNMMTDVLRSVFEIMKASTLRPLVLIHLRDIMSPLLQILHAGEIKKPVKGDSTAEAKDGAFIMTEEWYQKLMKDRSEFKSAYEKLISDIYKPLVIKELLILLSPAPSLQFKKEIVPPRWLRRNISQQLSLYLTNPDGVALIMRAMCDSSADTVDWKKVESIAKAISTVQGTLSPEEFYSLIGPQIISLLSLTGPYCLPVARKCIKNIEQYNSEMCRKYLFDKLFEPFIVCSESVRERGSEIVVTEDALSRSIDQITKCFAPGSKESALSFKFLLRIIKIVFRLYMKVADFPYEHQQAIRDILTRFLYSYDDHEKLTSIYDALIFDVPNEAILEMSEDLEFAFGPSGGVQVVVRCKAEVPDIGDDGIQLESEIAGDHMLSLLTHNAELSRKLLYDLYVVLLSSMCNWYIDDIEIPNPDYDILADIDELIVYAVRKSQKKIISVKLLSLLSEDVSSMEIPKDPETILPVLGSLLDKTAEIALRCARRAVIPRNKDCEDYKKIFLTLSIGTLAILDVATKNIKVGADTWNHFTPFLKSVSIIKDNCGDVFTRFLCEALHMRIMTHGAVSTTEEFLERPSRNEEEASRRKWEEEGTGKSVIVDVSETGSELEIALKEACSEDVPTRGHGLITLTKLLRKKDPETLSKKEHVFAILKANLGHSDTYIYLAAIFGLEGYAFVDAEAVIEILSNEYSEKDDFEMNMKVGEAMVRITRTLGETVPKYKSILINTFLRGTKHKDEYLRASSLSNLGEVLKILGFGVGPILQEVYVCVKSIAETDKSDLARRAAVLVAQLLLKGVTESSFLVLETVIRDLYRTLLYISKTDRDDVTRFHAESALAEIDRLVRSSFNPPLKLEKHIGILSLQR